MRVLGIMGSSRRDGNTNDLLDVALQAASEAGAEVEKIVLLDYEIKHILNCKDCAERGVCLNEDDFLMVMDKVFAADVHIWASPLYWYTVSGLVKVLLDRFSCYLYWYPEALFEERMARKAGAVITVWEEEGADRGEDLLGSMQKCFTYLKQPFLGYAVGPGGSRGVARKSPEAVRAARELGLRVAQFVPPDV
jgi:multimeric flavodoxin WrbA